MITTIATAVAIAITKDIITKTHSSFFKNKSI